MTRQEIYDKYEKLIADHLQRINELVRERAAALNALEDDEDERRLRVVSF